MLLKILNFRGNIFPQKNVERLRFQRRRIDTSILCFISAKVAGNLFFENYFAIEILYGCKQPTVFVANYVFFIKTEVMVHE